MPDWSEERRAARTTGGRGLSALARQAAARTRAVSGRVHDHAVVTPLIGMAAATEECGTEILLKCEHQQTTGSFKVRGALAKLLGLSDEQRDRGVVAASSGNHGLGVAHALSALGGKGIVCVPEVRWVFPGRAGSTGCPGSGRSE